MGIEDLCRGVQDAGEGVSLRLSGPRNPLRRPDRVDSNRPTLQKNSSDPSPGRSFDSLLPRGGLFFVKTLKSTAMFPTDMSTFQEKAVGALVRQKYKTDVTFSTSSPRAHDHSMLSKIERPQVYERF
ncbi:hypothetical protein J3459_012020 [Metarhizium acridum]|nr:hypothetical protein J3459_012020 [Metarhizium acridum]